MIPRITRRMAAVVLYLFLELGTALRTNEHGLFAPISQFVSRSPSAVELGAQGRAAHNIAAVSNSAEAPLLGDNRHALDDTFDAERLLIGQHPGSSRRFHARSLNLQIPKKQRPLQPRGLPPGDHFEPTDFLPGFPGTRRTGQRGSEERKSGSRASSSTHSELNTKDRFDTFALSTGERSWTQVPRESEESPRLGSKMATKEIEEEEDRVSEREGTSQLRPSKKDHLLKTGKNTGAGEIGPNARPRSETGAHAAHERHAISRSNTPLGRTKKIPTKKTAELESLKASHSYGNTNPQHPLQSLRAIEEPEWKKVQQLREEQLKSPILKMRERRELESELQAAKAQETKSLDARKQESKSPREGQRFTKSQRLKEQLLKAPHLKGPPLKSQKSKVRQGMQPGDQKSEEWVSLEGMSAREATERDARAKARFFPVQDEEEADKKQQQELNQVHERFRLAQQSSNPGVKDIAASLNLYGKGFKGKLKDRFSGR